MAAVLREIEISRIPELERLVEELEQAGQSAVLVRDGRRLAFLDVGNGIDKPVSGKRGGSEIAASGPLGREIAQLPATPLREGYDEALDPFLEVLGMFDSGGPRDIAENKNKYLAEAYMAEMNGPPES